MLEFDIDSGYASLVCDECSSQEDHWGDRQSQAEKSAMMSGWRRSRGPDGQMWTCPNCVLAAGGDPDEVQDDNQE